MHLKSIQQLELPATADMHVHLRQGELMELMVPTVRQGGVDTAFVMPNLVPPLTNVDQVLDYQSKLRTIAKDVNFLMSLFLHPSITPDVIAQAAAAGITGVKMYPQGVTTNSESGVSNLESFYDTFAAMEKHGLVLNLHGEVLESLAPKDVTLEEAFLPTLKTLHERFPQLRIMLEHCTTAAAVEAVRACGPTVGATITAHHLYLTSHDACCDPFAFCKPIPKKPTDRDALVRTIVSGDPKFFFGSDSAPHPLQSKTSAEEGKAPAGVYTQPFVTQLVIVALEEAIERGTIKEEDVTQAKLEGFLSKFGRQFYRLPEASNKVVLERKGEKIPTSIRSEDGSIEVGISKVGTDVFSLRWV
ncbi:amidohydrolase 2 [Annulohypoxylon maeteangense]|uniref:amidohydrolase 2 n=1 Tax=Annulohypoxylon maeteangense TaxID=1927788 RepID=UPI0020087013|nr:amidohydrolase 2 [Annulohypoxylon maeteangense]KAI0880340.1 amidohydrolase 2 [Annulohypoxylon maeteangense]